MMPPPRFGANACAGAKSDCARNRPETGHANQEDKGVVYDDPKNPKALHHTDVAGTKVFDVNTDGVAHYGMLPDFLQDLVNVGVKPEELSSLLEGLEDSV